MHRFRLDRRLRAYGLALTLALLGTATTRAEAQQPQVTGRVTASDVNEPLSDVRVIVLGTSVFTVTNAQGNFTLRGLPAGSYEVRVLRVGYQEQKKSVAVTASGPAVALNFAMVRTVVQLQAVVTTATGEQRRVELGNSVATIDAAKTVESGSVKNMGDLLVAKAAGVQILPSNMTAGGSRVRIRGTSSLSLSNDPIYVIDGVRMTSTGGTGIGVGGTAPSRVNDINPEEIENIEVVKGPSAATLYGTDAANGVVVITTKRGRAGTGGFEYSSSIKMESTRNTPELQRTYGLTSNAGFSYFGAPYAAGTTFYDNIDGFFRTALTQRHNLAFSGAAPENRINYRVAMSADKQEGVVPNSDYSRINLTGASQSQVNRWLRADLSMQYALANNNQAYKGDNGPLIGLLLWPQTDNAKDWLTPSGNRRRLTTAAASGEADNPYFNVGKNRINSKNSRLVTNLGLIATPFSWVNVKSNIGMDSYTNENSILRHPESVYGNTYNGVLDEANDITRNLTAQTLVNFERYDITSDLSINGLVGNQVSDFKSTTAALKGQDFLDPNFVSINNTNLRTNRTTLLQRRLVSLFSSATLNYKDYLYLTGTLRNDWTSTIPQERNSFMYPSISGSFVFTDAFPSLKQYLTGRLRGGYAEVGKDARPYAFRPSLEYKTTSYGGYGYGFTGPNLGLKPEFARSYEFGTELGFFKDRLGVDVTWYRKQTKDQIVNDIRGSYATGFILFNLNGAVTRNEGWEVTMRGTPVETRMIAWDVQANFERARGKVLALPNALPESYVSDTWLFGNVRNGTAPGLSTRSLTGLFYLRNNKGDILIDPTTGLPLRSTIFIDGGYDRQPDYTIGLTNTFRHRRWTLNFLVDIRKGGDVLNATEQFLTARGLSKRTLDREKPRVIAGVLRDGKENSATPTPNNIVVIPAVQTQYYTSISEELFIEKDINWLRMRDITLRYQLPRGFLRTRDASVFVTGTDLFLITNYSGLDPIVNGNTAAVGGSGASGIDYGNFPMPRGFTFGFKVGF